MELDDGPGEGSQPPNLSPSTDAAALPEVAGGDRKRPSDDSSGGGGEDRGAALMFRWQTGDDGAFDELVHEYSSHVYALLTRFLGRSHAGREDLVQEVFIRILGAKGRYEPTARFTTWLYSICWRLCVNQAERSALRRTTSLDRMAHSEGGDGPALQLVDDGAPDPVESLERGDLVAAVRDAIADLPESQRIAIVLARYHQLPYGEIATIIDSSEKAVKSLIHRARETLRETLQPLSGEENR